MTTYRFPKSTKAIYEKQLVQINKIAKNSVFKVNETPLRYIKISSIYDHLKNNFNFPLDRLRADTFADIEPSKLAYIKSVHYSFNPKLLSKELTKRPITKEQIWLRTDNFVRRTPDESEQHVTNSFNRLSLDADRIQNLVERAFAHYFIAKFANDAEEPAIALLSAYRAIATIAQIKKRTVKDYQLEGNIYEFLGELYSSYGTKASITKAMNYFLLSEDCYDDAKLIDKAKVARHKYLSAVVQMIFSEFNEEINDKDENTQLKYNVTNELLKEYINTGGGSFRVMKSIGTILMIEKDFNTAIQYFQAALLLSLDQNPASFLSVLAPLCLAYIENKESYKAIELINLALSRTSHVDLHTYYYPLQILKLATNVISHNEDSAFSIIKMVDEGLTFSYPFHRKQIQNSMTTYYSILSNLHRERKNFNSAFGYKEVYIDLVKRKENIVTRALEGETTGLNRLLIDIGEREVQLQIALKEISDSVALANERLALSNAQKAELFSTNERLAKDTVRLLEKNAKIVAAARIKDQWIAAGIVLTTIALASVAIYLTYFWQRYRKQAANNLGRSKIHNLEKDYLDLNTILANYGPESQQLYVKAYRSYLASTLKNWRNGEKTTLNDELDSLKKFHVCKKVMKNVDIDINLNGIDPVNVKFIPSIFDTLLDNSVRHGFKNRNDKCSFLISIKREGRFLCCNVSDNGTPPVNKNAFFAHKEHGLSVLRTRIFTYRFLSTRRLRRNFKISTSPNGTTISFLFPYATT